MRRVVLCAAATAGLTLTGCGSNVATGSAGMSSAGVASGNSGMMRSGGGYHFRRLRCSAPRSLPGRTVLVTLADMGMTQMMGGTAPLGVHMMLHTDRSSAPAGHISLVASNLGWRTHELVVLRLAAGAVAGHRLPGSDGKVSERESVGEASHSCGTGVGTGIAAGTVSWTTLTLTAGDYELVCNLPNHYADGMYEELVVT